MTVLSTTSKEDLSIHNNEFVQFSTELPCVSEEKYLQFDSKWLISADYGCSCGFRHLSTGSIDLGFDEPKDWSPEEAESIKSTLQFIQIIRTLVERNECVDCIDAWCGDQDEAEPLDGDTDIHLDTMNDNCFRFFENYRFNFIKQ